MKKRSPTGRPRGRPPIYRQPPAPQRIDFEQVLVRKFVHRHPLTTMVKQVVQEAFDTALAMPARLVVIETPTTHTASGRGYARACEALRREVVRRMDDTFLTISMPRANIVIFGSQRGAIRGVGSMIVVTQRFRRREYVYDERQDPQVAPPGPRRKTYGWGMRPGSRSAAVRQESPTRSEIPVGAWHRIRAVAPGVGVQSPAESAGGDVQPVTE